MVELGVWFVGESNYSYPPGATWSIVNDPSVTTPQGINKILDWLQVHLPWGNPFVTASQLNEVEAKLKTVNWASFWGTLFICEEHDKIIIAFEDSLNTQWFSEQLLGFPLWLNENPGKNSNQWLDDMLLRMMRGFTVYIHSQGSRVGQTMPNPSIIARPDWGVDYLQYYYGSPAYQYMRNNFDFIVAYNYTTNLNLLDDSYAFYYYLSQDPANRVQGMPEYLSKIDTDFGRQKKFWILTRRWSNTNIATWTPEAVALEMKNILDRNMTIVYQDEDPPLSEQWERILKSIQLYNANTPYYQSIVNGVNALTGFVGDTYGWVLPIQPPQQRFRLQINVNPMEGGIFTLSPEQPSEGYLAGTQVRVVAISNLGYSFIDWVIGANHFSSNQLSFAMTIDYTLTANFVRTTETPTKAFLTVNINPLGSGSVTVNPPQPIEGYIIGTNIVLTAIPAANFEFVDWIADSYHRTGITLNVWMGSNASIVANFTAVITPPSPKSGTAAVGGVEIGGYERMLPPTMVHFLWRLREKFISKEAHKRLHPIV